MNDLHRLAARQHGVVTKAQLVELGVRPGTVDDWARRGRLRRIRPSVFAMAGAGSGQMQSLAAAVLAAGAGAVVSHRSAAWLWGLMDNLTLEVTVPRQRRPRLSGVVVHRPLRLDGSAVSVRRGLALTNPLRTLVELGAVLPAEDLAEVVERVLIRRLVSVAGLRAEMARFDGSRSSSAVLREVLAERALGAKPSHSVLETKTAELLRRCGVPSPVYQYEVR